MTCPEVRELLSALLDDALSPTERQAIDGHLATCAECPRELAALRETVALLKGLPPVHAPVGFVDRVVETAYRPSWPRRVGDALFRPFRVKLPLEAAAVVLVGISALYVYQHAPEVQEVARQETPAVTPPASVPEPPVPPSRAGEAGSAPSTMDAATQGKEKPVVVEQEATREPGLPAATPPVPAAPAPTVPRKNVNPPSAAPGAAASGPAPAPAQEPKVTTSAEAKKETVDQRREDTAAAPHASATLQKRAQSADPAPSRDAAGPHADPAPALPQSAGAPPPEARSRLGDSGAAPSEAPVLEPAPQPFSVAKPRAAARLMRASDASGRLVVSASEPAEIALDALLTRLGGTRVARRLEEPRGPILVDVIISAARYPELLEGLGTIGRWTTEHEPKTLPAQVRVEVAVSVER